MYNEVIALLKNDDHSEHTAWLRINPNRQYFDDRLGKRYCINGLPEKMSEMQCMKAHPHMT